LKLALLLLKNLPEELAHSLALGGLKFLHNFKILNLFIKKPKNNEFQLLGMNFKNKLGTAAGLDKNGDYIDSLGALGFGFLEVGTITPLAQPGNDKPRLFRIFDERAIVNRMGFNNKGVDHLVKNLKNINYDGVIGVNIGANKSSEGQKRIDDYLFCFKKVYKLADYIVINISSPNTPSLRDLHDEDNLSDLLSQIASLSSDLNNTKPIFLKVSPDESNKTIERIVEEIKKFNFSGLIATNTTIDKKLLKNSHYHSYKGGLSGAPLLAKSNETIKCIRSIDEKVPLIGVGGVMSKDDFDGKLNSGANLIQVYTGFILKGPSIINELLD
jgi:dihydroorotate dehydrogenase